jgi:hypothetical protein
MPMTPYKRAFRTVKKTAKKRYYNKSTGSLRLNRIVKDVYNLKQAINSEKKHHLVEPSSQVFAQYNNTTSGHETMELTPAIPQGTGSNQRIGNQVKLTGACMELKLTKQGNQHGTIAYKIMLVRKPDGNDTLDIADFIEGNHFISGATIYDTASQRNQQQMGNFKIVKTLSGRFNQDQNTEIGDDTQIVRNFTIPLKFTKDNMIRYNTGASTQSIKNRYYLVCLASNGDQNNGSGIQIQQYTRWYYVDN